MSEPSSEQEASESEQKTPERKKSVRKKSVRKSVSRKSVSRKSVSRKKSMRKQSVKSGSAKKRLSVKGGGPGKKILNISKEIAEEQNPLVKTGQGVFKFKNHDRYIGGYMATYPYELIRDGLGIYSTHDGLVYKGTWGEDNLLKGTIQWPCGQRYVGELSDGKYWGYGKYYLPGRGELYANFENNMPKGKVAFKDEAGLIYTGEVIEGEEVLTLIPLNHYLPANIEELVPKEPPKPATKTKHKKMK